jgi:hypothetical protein
MAVAEQAPERVLGLGHEPMDFLERDHFFFFLTATLGLSQYAVLQCGQSRISVFLGNHS